jgi:hypothetical protein
MVTYSKAVEYAKLFVHKDLARDLVHDLWLSLNKRGIDLFNTSKRFCYIALYNFNRSSVVGSMEYRHGVRFVPVDRKMSDGWMRFVAEGFEWHNYVELQSNVPNPEQILIGKEISETFSTELTLYIEGYTTTEIGKLMGRTREGILKTLKKQKQLIHENRVPHRRWYNLRSRAESKI